MCLALLCRPHTFTTTKSIKIKVINSFLSVLRNETSLVGQYKNLVTQDRMTKEGSLPNPKGTVLQRGIDVVNQRLRVRLPGGPMRHRCCTNRIQNPGLQVTHGYNSFERFTVHRTSGFAGVTVEEWYEKEEYMRKRSKFMAGVGLAAAVLFSGGQLVYGGALGPAGVTFYANSPQGLVGAVNTGTALSKFVDGLPGVGLPGCTVSTPTPGTGTCNENNLGQYIPVATKVTNATFPNDDYYEIGIVDYTAKMHTNLPKATKLRGYKDLAPAAAANATQYLGPLILATKDRPVRIKFTNQLGVGTLGNLFIPVDTTVMGAGAYTIGDMANPASLISGNFTQNRQAIHLHGGATPWISDGTPHQWFVPAGDSPNYPQGQSFRNVPDMGTVPAGSQTIFYSNQQSARLMFYHDHAMGTTRLNVYAGGAAAYLVTDPQEEYAITTGLLPNTCAGGGATVCGFRYGVPLVFQDKTFVPLNIATQDSLWDTVNWGTNGDLWLPHVYEPNQSLTTANGLNPYGRWDYGPWVWPPVAAGSYVTPLPQPSYAPEAFMDTAMVNGTAYPNLTVDPKAYRFRILNAANDRPLNLQLYYAVDSATQAVKCNSAGVPAATCTEVAMAAAIPRAACSATVTTNCTCVIGFNPAGCFPATWPTDGRDGGAPDPANIGPDIIQIGTEGGFLPAPVVIPSQPVTFDPDGNILGKALLLMPAERADVIIDFSAIPAGSTLILYNDAPAPLPGGDPRNDYYTGNPDQSASGGSPSTVAGFGPNTRTIMQFRVSAAAPSPVYDLAALQNTASGLPAMFAGSQPAPIVTEAAYGLPNGPYNVTYTDNYSKIFDTTMTVNGASMPLKGKSLNDTWEPMGGYGRMLVNLGDQAPDGQTAAVPYAFVDPVTDVATTNQTQLWKITNNSVDAHPIHFHIVNVQVVNRIGWNGEIIPPEPNELGWKETVRMNPFQDVIVAFRATPPTLPFAVPNSVRYLNPTQPIGSTMGFSVAGTVNAMTNLGQEYMWHCHILGHEEADMMRPLVLDRGLAPDFNYDGKSDILWRNTTTGANRIWYMNGTSLLSTVALMSVTDPAWVIGGTGDFNNDGYPDILWRHSTGVNAIWYMNGATFLGDGTLPSDADAAWKMVGTGDFDNNGYPDILWRNTTTGANRVWYMNNGLFVSSAALPSEADLGWAIAGTDDFNNDGKPDIIWRHTSGANAVWYMNGTSLLSTAALTSVADSAWTIAGTGDYNSDGHPDIVWRHSTGVNAVWYLDGVTFLGDGTLPSDADPAWTIANR